MENQLEVVTAYGKQLLSQIPSKQTVMKYQQFLSSQILYPLLRISFFQTLLRQIKQTQQNGRIQLFALFTFIKQYISLWKSIQSLQLQIENLMRKPVQPKTELPKTIPLELEMKKSNEYIEQYFPISNISELNQMILQTNNSNSTTTNQE